MNNFSTQTDAELLRQCPSSTQAQGELIDRYARLVRVFARRFFLLGGDYEDLVQEGMIGLLTAVRQYRLELGSFPNYAAVCIKSRLISAVRSAAARKHAPLNESVSISTYSSADYLPEHLCVSPEELLIDKELYSEYLVQLTKRLSALEKRILDAYLDGMSCSEIADTIHKSLKSVNNAVQRIKQKAAAILSRR